MKIEQIPIKTLSIKNVAEKTGLSPQLIRAWENRYKAIVPDRTESNRRLFCESDVLRLQLLKKATDSGHSISQIAKLTFEELLRIINANETIEAKKKADACRNPDANYFYDWALNCVLELDGDGLKSALEQASVHLTKLMLIKADIVPLCQKIGYLWRNGELKIINEHMATPIIRSILWNLLNSVEVSREAPRIVIATPLNHRHDIGALAIAITARESGWRALFFGSNLPANEIAAAVMGTKARAVALSITFSLNHQKLVDEIKKLRGYLNTDVTIFIGGRVASSLVDHPDTKQVQLINDIDSFNSALDGLLNCGQANEI